MSGWSCIEGMLLSTHPSVPVVLLVEDDPGDVLLVTEALERSRTPPILYVVNDGQEALDFLRSVPTEPAGPAGPEARQDGRLRPNLILLDLNMPRMDGRQALAAIKADASLRSIPVVVLTTSDAESDVLASYHRYASAFVTKPLDLEDLETVVDQIGHFYMSVSRLPPVRRQAG
jgi:CheY-like chemotaxis protein